MSAPKNFLEYLQALPADSEVHAVHERYGRALDNVQGLAPLFIELKAAATSLRSLLQESADSQFPLVATYSRMLAADAELAGAIANSPLEKEFFG